MSTSFKVGEYGATLTSSTFSDSGTELDLSDKLVQVEIVNPYGTTSTASASGSTLGVATYTTADGDFPTPGRYHVTFSALSTGSYLRYSDTIEIDVGTGGSRGPEIASVGAVKAAMRIPDTVTEYDTTLKDCILAAEQDILDITGLSQFSVTTYTEKHDVNWDGQNEFRLDRRWVQSVVALTDAGTLLVEGTDYYVDTDDGYVRLLSDSAYFTPGRQKIDVTYTAGLIVAGATPADLRKALVMMVARDFNVTPRAGMESERIGRRQYKLSSGASTAADREIDRILAKYQRVFV